MNHKAIKIILLLLIAFGFNKTILAQNSSPKMTSKFITPAYLKPGDTIAIVAPSGILINKEKAINDAKLLMERWGLHVLIGKHIYNKHNHFAGTDDERCEDFQWAINHPNIKAIWCARGGYGSVRILDKLDFSTLKKHPKWIIGYSDITAILNTLYNNGIESIHGMMAVNLSENKSDIKNSIETLKHTLFGKPLHYELPPSKYNRQGETTGKLIGGNLTLLNSMLGSETSLDTKNSILFIEEVGEYKYHIDRMLQSLKRADYFKNCNGIIVGDFSKVKQNTTSWGSDIETLILNVVNEYNFPVVFNMPAGHEPENRALIFGRDVTISVKKDKSTITFK